MLNCDRFWNDSKLAHMGYGQFSHPSRCPRKGKVTSKSPCLSWKLQLIEEVDRVLKGQKPQWDDLGKLPYTLAVINETLRHDAPFMNFPRVAYCDAELEGHCIPNGVSSSCYKPIQIFLQTNIWISPALVMMNPNAWPNPTQFNPERFMGDVSVNNSKFMAFGFGPRACMGRMFVLHEATIVLVCACFLVCLS